VLSEGQEIDVKLIGFDRGKMKLSAKALIEKSKPEEPETDSSSEE
jgi:polyribonucleotide nucleotidyltransferase